MSRPFPLILSLVLCAPALAQGPTPPPLSVSTGSANVPKNANPADIQDLRVLTKASEDPYEYERLGLGAVSAGTLPRARRFFERSWTLGELPTSAYNIACLDLREGKQADALRELTRALDAGFDDEDVLARDPDMEPLRTRPEWNGFVESARRNRALGDAAVVPEGLFLAPAGAPAAILVLLHDSSSDPLKASGPFVSEAKARGLFLAVPRGPARLGRHGFGWGSAARSFAAIDAVLAAARSRAGRPDLPVFLAGLGRGGTLAFARASLNGGFAGVASIGGPYDRSAAGREGATAPGLRGARLFFGVSAEAPQNLLSAFHRGISDVRGLGLRPTIREWPGTGTTFPADVKRAVKDALDGITPAKKG
ncbi:MAG TPA: hypothetical protein VKF32_08795 [Thermoanaerobaculia bacterium]|nr:hypothetical protein [Thermoanaerobaculia bacterium]